jgi:hypothetical protein
MKQTRMLAELRRSLRPPEQVKKIRQPDHSESGGFLVVCLRSRDFKNEKRFQSVILYILEEGWMLKLPVTIWIVLF